jgi:hypothetical protein
MRLLSSKPVATRSVLIVFIVFLDRHIKIPKQRKSFSCNFKNVICQTRRCLAAPPPLTLMPLSSLQVKFNRMVLCWPQWIVMTALLLHTGVLWSAIQYYVNVCGQDIRGLLKVKSYSRQVLQILNRNLFDSVNMQSSSAFLCTRKKLPIRGRER